MSILEIIGKKNKLEEQVYDLKERDKLLEVFLGRAETVAEPAGLARKGPVRGGFGFIFLRTANLRALRDGYLREWAKAGWAYAGCRSRAEPALLHHFLRFKSDFGAILETVHHCCFSSLSSHHRSFSLSLFHHRSLSLSSIHHEASHLPPMMAVPCPDVLQCFWSPHRLRDAAEELNREGCLLVSPPHSSLHHQQVAIGRVRDDICYSRWASTSSASSGIEHDTIPITNSSKPPCLDEEKQFDRESAAISPSLSSLHSLSEPRAPLVTPSKQPLSSYPRVFCNPVSDCENPQLDHSLQDSFTDPVSNVCNVQKHKLAILSISSAIFDFENSIRDGFIINSYPSSP
ncbi:hypothetical protein F2Q70_00042741 [Brassica cretica]|uniref:Uncharacterized protein n=1 Tax=Brassica cretica TaxID=69181 RepID=A0A8S9KIS5_BRACR|nr:hypothetical protein F2Q70_00042741 [Brassica cretica]